MIGTGFDVRVKIQDMVSSQLPEYILTDAPLTDDFLKQFYISQEFQGGAIDFASNLDQYLKLDQLTEDSVYGEFYLTQPLGDSDDVVYVNSTKSFPNEWGLIKVDDEIITYTGITTNSLTGAVRGFSGVTTFRSVDNPSELSFESTEAAAHESGAPVQNLSTLFLKEFYNKIKFTFAPGFENLEFNSDVNVGNWIRQARSFYQTKGSEESIKILFKVLFGEEPRVIDLEQFLFKSSESEYSRRDYAIGIPLEGNPVDLKGKTVVQSNAPSVFGAVSEVEPFTRDGRLYYRIYLFVGNDEIGDEKKLFAVPAITKAQRSWKQGDQTITVDSTIGFRDNGEFVTADGVVFKYETRTVNQFLGVTCDSLEKEIAIGDEIIDDITINGVGKNGDIVKLRLTGVLSDLNFSEDGVPFSSVGEKIRVDSLGENIISDIAERNDQTFAQVIANSFIYNTSVRFQVSDLSGSTFKLSANYLDNSTIRAGDTVDILFRSSNQAYAVGRLVASVDYTSSTVTIDDSFGIPTDQPLDIRRNQRYANSNQTPIDYGNNSVLSNVLNLYDATEYDSNYYVATNSLPSYDINVKIIESSIAAITTSNLADYNSFTGEYSTLVFDSNVEFLTGDTVSYSVAEGTEPICALGEYFIEVMDDPRRVRLYLSPSFIGGTNNVALNETSDSGTHIFTLENQKNRIINTRRAYRKIPISNVERQNVSIDRTPESVDPGTIAILTNGVDIISYKGTDSVFLGPLVSVDPVGGGSGYSVVSPPELVVAESNIQLQKDDINLPAETAKITPVVKGKLEKILIDPQDFDIDKVFSITVVGGNSPGATAIPQIERTRRSIPFDSRTDQFGGGVNPIEETIQFLTEHRITKGEALVYNNRGTDSIGVAAAGGSNAGNPNNLLANGGIYYAEPVNNLTIRLYPSINDLLAGINTVGFTSSLTGYGVQSFDTLSKNRLTGATITEDGGDFYYRSLAIKPDHVFVAYDEIRYHDHGFGTGDLVEYHNYDTPVGGLTTSNMYYVTRINEDTFKLSDAGIGGTSTYNYRRGEFVNLSTAGVGTHTFKYPDISVEVVVSFASTVSGEIVATPIVRGEIEQIYVDEGGSYGSDILNFEKNPNIDILTGTGARVKPIIVDGAVIAVQILNKGRNYPNTPDLNVIDRSGAGRGAVLRAVVVNGEIDDVVIINGGFAYSKTETDIRVVDTGRDAILIPRIRKLTGNIANRFGFETLIQNNYSIVSYDRTIRENVYDDFGNTHSPIIGWARDGNPIYGGFALSDPQDFNSGFRAMETSYTLDPEAVESRPSLNLYPAGFFIEDYQYTGLGDLDEYNGRYCRTPEFPNGVYAYFAGISTDVQSNAREPQFPYFIGPKYRDSLPEDTIADVSQDFDLNDKPIFRNTFPYAVGDPTSGSEFITQSYLFDVQDTIINSIDSGSIDRIDVVGAGQSFRVGDIAVFEFDEDTLSSVVTRVNGKDVISIQQELLTYNKEDTKIIRLDDKTVRVYVSQNHELSQNDTVVFSSLSKQTQFLSNPFPVKVNNKFMTLYSPVQSIPTEGVTDIFVNTITENVSVGSSVVVGFGNTIEIAEVINIFPINKALRIRRPDTGGAPAHAIGDAVTPLPNYFDVNAKGDSFASELDYSYYFNPQETFGLGLQTGETYGTVFSIGSIDYNIALPTQSIYAPGHKFVTNEPVTFSKSPSEPSLLFSDGTNIYSLPNNVTHEDTVYVVKLTTDLIGIRTDPNGSNLFITSDGDGSFLYNLTTQRFAESATVDRIDAVVTTTEPHSLQNGDKVTVAVNPSFNSGVGTNSTIVVEYDSISKSLVIDPREATSAGINTEENTITIDSHGYVLGEYLLYENSTGVIGGLENRQKYFVVPFDENKFSLAKTFADIKLGSENIISLTDQGSGAHKFGKVNPKLNIVKNNDIEFDISSPTLLNTELKFFYDQTLTEIFLNNGIDKEFVVSGVGTHGYADARKFVRFSDNNPDIIYYGLDVGGFISTADNNANFYNAISYRDSSYTTEALITTTGDERVFKYSLPERPEAELYTSSNTQISYQTSSKNVLGGVGAVRIISTGNNFTRIPEFITIDSEFGTNATLKAQSSDIGRLSSFRIQNPGWGYSADNTLRPKGKIQPKVEFTDSDFINFIDVVSGGNGYQTEPTPVLIDSVTREEIDNGSLDFVVQSSTISEVIVDVAPSGLSKNNHELFTLNNTNAIPILLVNDFDQVSGIVTFTVQTPIAGYGVTPFNVGDQVFIENIIPEVGQESNMNSKDYGYKFFDVVGVGSNPLVVTVQYPEEALGNIGAAVTFQGGFSGMVNRKNYPTFSINQSTAIFVVGERLSIFDAFGELQEIDLVIEESNTNFFKYRGNYDILVGDVLKGGISGVVVTVTSIQKDECRYTVSAISRVETGWNNEIGFLNDEFQVIPDNDYYQNLSYSIKSEVNYEDLVSPVNRLVHPSGLKNFSDTKIESSASIGIGATSGTNITIDLIGLTDVAETPLRVDRINSFDLGYDNEISDNKSNAIRFNSKTPNKRLTDFIEVRTNRVLMHDDISPLFIDSDNIRGQKPWIDFNVVSGEFTRGLLQVRNPFTDEIEFTEIVSLTTNNNAYTLQKATVSPTDEGYGTFDAVSLNSTEYALRYTPFNVETFDIDAKLYTNKFVSSNETNDLNLANITLDGLQATVLAGANRVLYRAPNVNGGGVVIHMQLTDLQGQIKYYEYYVFKLGTNSYSAQYGFSANSIQGFSEDFVGDIAVNIDFQNRLTVVYRNTTAQDVIISTKNIEFSSDVIGDPIYRFKKNSIPDGAEESLNLISTTSSGTTSDISIDLITLDVDRFQAMRVVTLIRGVTVGGIHQVMAINSDGSTYTNAYPFITEGDDADPSAGIGSFGTEVNGSDWTLKFYPDAGLPALEGLEFITYAEAFYRIIDNINYTNKPLIYSENEENYYLDRYIAPLGQRTNNVRFPLTYQGIPIYQKIFNPGEQIEVDRNGVLNTFLIEDHFFSDKEALEYAPGNSVEGGAFEGIGIQTVTDYLGVSTDIMPEKVWCIKLDINRFQLAPTELDANTPIDQGGVRIVVTGIGTGNAHTFDMVKKLEKTVVTIDGVTQAPLSSAQKVYTLDASVDSEINFFNLTGIGTIRVGDLLLIEDEYVKIDNIGLGTQNIGPITNTGTFPLIEVERGVVGSSATSHTSATDLYLYRGSYNIVDSDIVFTEAPSGKGPFSINESNLVEINSSYQGRTFLQKEYDKITLIDDISDQFDGKTNEFTLTSMGSTVGEIENGSGTLIINDIYQTPTTNNNEGNNYFYEYDSLTGENTVIFTGITSENGDRVESIFDVNQNQIPRGGLIVSLGSTPGLGYAPLSGAKLQVEVTSGSVTNIFTEDQVGVGTDIQYAKYNKNTGELDVTIWGPPATSQIAITGADYLNVSGQLIITTAASLSSLGIAKNDIVVLRGIEFSCVNSGITTTIFPDKDNSFPVVSVVDDNRFSVDVGISTIVHTYVTGGTFQKYEAFEFGTEGNDPLFAYLDQLEFSCPSGQTVGLTTTLFPAFGGNAFSVVFRTDDAHYKILVGVSTLVHDYVGGGTISQYTKNNPGSGYRDAFDLEIIPAEGDSFVGTAASVRAIPGAGGELSFSIIDGGSGYTEAYATAPDPVYFNLPVEGVYRRTVGFTTLTGENLFVTCEVAAATTTAIGRSEYFEISNYEISNQGYSFLPGDVVKVVGLVTDKRLAQPIEEFQLTILDTFTDNFAAWNFGELDYIDSIKPLQDGYRSRFPLIYKGQTFSFEQNPSDEDSAAIDLDAILLIYVNTVLQVPGVNYVFDGGTSFEFTRAPFPEDDIDIYFYRGKRNIDSTIVTEINESLRPGDVLQVRKNNAIDGTKTQDLRTATEIASSDTIRTNLYVGANDLSTSDPREVAWEKQKRDKFIYGQPVFKTRDSIESVIRPKSSIIRTVTSSATQIFVDSAALFEYEENVPGSSEVLTGINARMYKSVQDDAESQDPLVPAEITVDVNASGQVSAVNLINGGQNYPLPPQITVAAPIEGTRAVLSYSVISGSIIFAGISNPGSGYDPANPPRVLISEPSAAYEDLGIVETVQGFSGIITGITGIPGATKQIRFDYKVDPEKVPTTASLVAGYSVAISNTVVGNGVDTIGINPINIISTSDEYLDGVYEVRTATPLGFTGSIIANVSATTDINGIDSTGDDLGVISWGRLSNINGRNALTAISVPVDSNKYTADMNNYPQIIRTAEGLRNEGGLGKAV